MEKKRGSVVWGCRILEPYMPIAVVARPAIRERKETFCTLPPRIKGDEIILF